MTSSVIYYSTDARKNEIYLLNKPLYSARMFARFCDKMISGHAPVRSLNNIYSKSDWERVSCIRTLGKTKHEKYKIRSSCRLPSKQQ